MAPRTSKRLRGVLEDDNRGDVHVIDNEEVQDHDQRPASQRSGQAGDSHTSTGCKLSQEEIDALDAKVDKYRDEAQKAERALPENVTVTGHELDAATRAVVRFVLMNNSSNEGGLLTGRDLNAQIASVIIQKKGVPAVVIAKAQYVLAKSFGIELVELEKEGVKSGKYYILKSLCPGSVYTETVGKTESKLVMEQRGLLGFLVALIYMSCGSLPEPELWRHMESLGVAKARVAAMLEDALRKRYIKVDKSSMGSSMDEEVKVYAVAERALIDGMTEDAVLRCVETEFAED